MLKPVLNSIKYFLLMGLITISAGCNQLISTDEKTVEEFMTEYFTAIKSSKSDLNFTCDRSLLPEFYSLSNFKILKSEWDEKKGGEANVRITANNISTKLPITHTFVCISFTKG